ncbi:MULTISPECIES: carbohydrate kinase family protein [Archaeoglobus]|uniref:Sugar kinase, ribokinase family n=2 Tax=Archaeoglobus fulgidus TaxID=2234 RepID=A0A075WB02_ARCFL|nr:MULTISPECIES: carbohydrate kinase family protein [Archaeoglobus]AIG97176.1 Sugar kinase, ribokinase family [Archaeoglobus fulgidus DSM 8774]KUJ94331.1 MAG: putative sugar kinase [Archaeoglobus fulgidus]KUK06369.1 MAG: putative sugar kinase [Archaeoglobus fulgidus]MDI3497184.1 ribokinase [Archaeoglobus sp.]
MSSAIGFGALNLDKIYTVDKIPREDEEGFVIDLKLSPGGSAANTIVGLSRLGIETAYIGKVGSDEEGRILLADFEREGVSTDFVIRAEGRSGTAMIFVDEKGNRAILVDPGVNDTIAYDEIDVDSARKYDLIHLTSFICKNGLDSLNSQKRIVEEFDSVSFDPGMPYAERGLGDMEKILKNTTIFLPNRQEIEMLFSEDYRTAAERCIEMGIEIVAVKLGSEGCWIKKGDREVTVKPVSTKVVDTTGAGDAFNAGFLYGYLKGKDIEECGRLGNFVAAKCIEKYGAREGLPRSVD